MKQGELTDLGNLKMIERTCKCGCGCTFKTISQSKQQYRSDLCLRHKRDKSRAANHTWKMTMMTRIKSSNKSK